MKRWLKYCFWLFAVLTGCEEIYTPDLEKVENVIVADARLVTGATNNEIKLYNSLGYNDKSYKYPEVSGAKVSIITNNGSNFMLQEAAPGHFPVNISFNTANQYKIKIEYGGNSYESSFEQVPQMPKLDTVFGVAEKKLVAAEGENNIDNFIEMEGLQLYCNITGEKETPYYRFTARKVLQYYYIVEVPFFGGILQKVMYAWESSFPGQSFNIASPPEYASTANIVKHPLYFMVKKPSLRTGNGFGGWILILYQHGLSRSAYQYYSDLNKQLEANGKLFDPMYVQATSNLKCTNNPDQLILGNFEISTVTEYRYYVYYISDEKGYCLKPIPYFYEIPFGGEQRDVPPDFWEIPNKTYPTP